MNTSYEIRFNSDDKYIYLEKFKQKDVKDWKIFGSSEKNKKNFGISALYYMANDFGLFADLLFNDRNLLVEEIYAKLLKINEAAQIIKNRYDTKLSNTLWKLSHRDSLKLARMMIFEFDAFSTRLQPHLLWCTIKVDYSNKKQHDWEKLAKLIQRGNPSYEFKGESVVFMAVCNRDKELFKYLYTNRRDVKLPRRIRKEDNFMWISEVLKDNKKFIVQSHYFYCYFSQSKEPIPSSVEIVNLISNFIALGFDVNKKNKQGTDLLMIAIQNRDSNLAYTLVSEGAKLTLDHRNMYLSNSKTDSKVNKKSDLQSKSEIEQWWDEFLKIERCVKNEDQHNFPKQEEKHEVEVKQPHEIPKLNTRREKHVFRKVLLDGKRKFIRVDKASYPVRKEFYI